MSQPAPLQPASRAGRQIEDIGNILVLGKLPAEQGLIIMGLVSNETERQTQFCIPDNWNNDNEQGEIATRLTTDMLYSTWPS